MTSDTTTTEPATTAIPDWRMARLAQRFNRMAKTAARLGVPAPTYQVVATREVEVHQLVDGGLAPVSVGVSHVEIWHDVTVHGVAPQLAGYQLVAVIDRDLAEPTAPNLVHTLGDIPIDDAWRTVGDTCEHDRCNGAARGRRKIIVVRHTDSGVDRLVGSTCVADFLGGVSPEMVAWYCSLVDQLAGALGDDDEPTEPHQHTELRFGLGTVLAVTAAHIRENGWTSKGSAWETGRQATADQVIDQMLSSRPKNHVDVTDADLDLAAAARMWAVGLDDSDRDFERNLSAVARRDTINRKALGTACAMIPAYQRHQAGVVRREKMAGSRHFGTAGERLVVAADVLQVNTVATDFGTAAWVTAVTDDGNVVEWKASNAGRAPEVGQVIVGKATIKAHREFNDCQTTSLTRWSWTVHPDHCQHSYLARHNELNGNHRKLGRVACVDCKTPVHPADLLEQLSAAGQVALTNLAWADIDGTQVPCPARYGTRPSADQIPLRSSVGRAVPVDHALVTGEPAAAA